MDDSRRYRSVMNHKRTLKTTKRAVPAVLARLAPPPYRPSYGHRSRRVVACNGGASACEDGGDGSFWGVQGAPMVHYASVAPGIVRQGQYGHVGRSIGGRPYANLLLLFSYMAKYRNSKKCRQARIAIWAADSVCLRCWDHPPYGRRVHPNPLFRKKSSPK